MANIAIAVGTVYGGAKLVAEEIQNALDNHGHTTTLLDQAVAADLENDDLDILIVCTSTTGAGDLPEDLAPLYAQLVDAPPRVTNLRFAVIAMGDSSYADTYCGGGLQMDAALSDIGAIQLQEPLLLDALENVTPEDDAVPWAIALVEAHT